MSAVTTKIIPHTTIEAVPTGKPNGDVKITTDTTYDKKPVTKPNQDTTALDKNESTAL